MKSHLARTAATAASAAVAVNRIFTVLCIEREKDARREKRGRERLRISRGRDRLDECFDGLVVEKIMKILQGPCHRVIFYD